MCVVAQLCGAQCVVCVCMQAAALPTGNSWLCCFEVRPLSSDKQREEQVLEPADSSVQRVLFAFITVVTDQAIKKHITPNKVQVRSKECPYVLLPYLIKFNCYCYTV